MEFECIAINGFAGDRTNEAMECCHHFAQAFADYLKIPCTLVGEVAEAQDLPWDIALRESKPLFELAATHMNRILNSSKAPLLITPRCATAIATLPRVLSTHPDVMVIYFDAHGDLNLPTTSESGYLGGMPLTAVMGKWQSGYGSGLNPDQLIHIGGRDIDMNEESFINEHRITMLSKLDLEGDLRDLKEKIIGRPVYIHLDTDVYEPSEVSAEYEVEDGLFRTHVKKVVDLVVAQANLVGVEITELSPKNETQKRQSYLSLFESFSSLSLEAN